MAVDTPAKHVYTGNGNTRVFPIPTRIIGDDYVRIEIDGIHLTDRTQWDIVNNSVIFLTAPVKGSEINIQVATSEEALSVLGSVTNVDIVAENIEDINSVANSIINVNTTAINIASINTVSGNTTNINIVSSNIDNINEVVTNLDEIAEVNNNSLNITTVADNIVKAGVVADNIIDVNNVADNITSISSLASIRTKLESLYADKTKLTSIYNDKITLDSIYSDKSKLDDIFSALNAIEGLYGIKAKLESIYADKSKVDSIYADKTQLDTIYNNISNILTVYSSIANVITVSNNIASVNTTASNIVDVNTFSSKYKISSTQPSNPTAGDLWYDTIATVLKYYNGSSYVAVSPDVTLLLTNTKFISNISIGNTTLSGWTNSFSVIEAPGGTFFASNGIATLTGSNCYYDGVNWKYKVDGTAGLQLVNQGTHTFRVAVSGVADAIITWVTVASLSADGVVLPSNTGIGAVSATELQYLDGVTSNIQGQIDTKAPLLSPALTGTPTAPTASAGTNTTQLATTAFVKNAIPNVLNASGTAPMYACRAWVNFNGTGTVAIRASGNVSSITDNGVGDYTVNFTTAMADKNYSLSGFGQADQDNYLSALVQIRGSATPQNYVTTSNVRIIATRYAANGNADIDFSVININVFR